MRWIGLLGGMSIESSIGYERIITDEIRQRRGGTSSPRLVHLAVDFAEIEAMQEQGDWETAGRVMADGARRLEAAGAEVIVLCTNTMHRLANEITDAITVPFLHLADATADAVITAGVETVALLGTRYTMEQAFYRERLEAKGLTVLIPDEPDRTTVHDVIYDELVRGIIEPNSASRYREIAARMVDRGAEGVIAGCTEIELLLQPSDVAVPYFPTTRLHALAAVEFALN